MREAVVKHHVHRRSVGSKAEVQGHFALPIFVRRVGTVRICGYGQPSVYMVVVSADKQDTLRVHGHVAVGHVLRNDVAGADIARTHHVVRVAHDIFRVVLVYRKVESLDTAFARGFNLDGLVAGNDVDATHGSATASLGIHRRLGVEQGSILVAHFDTVRT